MMPTPSHPAEHSLLRLHNLSKTFGGQRALHAIQLELQPGEVHCLAGSNGCGKSTLIKIISGVYSPDAGAEIELLGQRYPCLTPTQARQCGVQVIYQDLSLFPNLSVAENIAFSCNLAGTLRWFRPAVLRQKAQAVLDELQFTLPLHKAVADLPIAQRQQVAICRALVAEARLVIMDEPTASLTRHEVRQLLRTLSYLKDKGITVVFVSHRLYEVLEISDRVTVLRDGSKIGTWSANAITQPQLTELITGRAIVHQPRWRDLSARQVILAVEQLSRAGQYQDISFQLRQGEVLGLCGLLGAGRTELALSLFGITRPDRGSICLDGRPMTLRSQQDAIQAGIGYVSEDRLTLGLILPQSVGDNLVLSTLDTLSHRCGTLMPQKKAETIRHWLQALKVKVGDPAQPIATLSGGNQQKVVLAKWLLTRPKVLILDAPTVGVDAGAKESLYQLIHDLAQQGLAILLISDEIPEVYYNCDRILHMVAGQIRHCYHPSRLSEQQLTEAING